MNVRQKTIRWMLVPAATLFVSAAGAQQQQTAPPAPKADPAPVIIDAGVRPRLRLFEVAIQEAVDRAGAMLAQWANSIVGAGGIYLVPAAPPKVVGVLLPDDGLAFDLHLAEMNATGFMMAQRRLQEPDPNGRITATGVVKADPPTGIKTTVDPNQQYSNLVRDALIDVLVESGWMLPVSGEQWVTIQVTPIDVLVRNPNYKNSSRRLTLSLRGADLDAFRAKTLTRDELRARVVDRRF